MSTSKTTSKLALRSLPSALAKQAEAASEAKRKRIIAEARKDIAIIRRRKTEITEAFYDIGEALSRLKRPGVAKALGYKNFASLCEKELEMSSVQAARLVEIVQKMSREDAVQLGQTKAIALLDLADATPEAESAASLQHKKVKLPSGKTLDVRHASSRELDEAAKEIRSSNPSKNPRGRSATAEERRLAAWVQARLRDSGASRATVVAVATKPGKPSDVRIEKLGIGELRLLHKALGALGREFS